MPNKTLFASAPRGRLIPEANTVNEAGGKAYELTSKHALAQYALTGTLYSSFYVKADTHLETLLNLCSKVEPAFAAKTAVASRQGHMKDIPAVICAYLHAVDTDLLAAIFDQVINNGKMLRNFVQIVRSGVTGRKSFGSKTKKLIQNWLTSRNHTSIMWDNIGSDPTLGDVIKMVHPKPGSSTQAALFAYVAGREYNKEELPDRFQQWEIYKENPSTTPPKVPFQMLTSLKLTSADWKTIAINSSWQECRQNLNTYARHDVFKNDLDMVQLISNKLADAEAVRNSHVFPYQLLAAYLNTGPMPKGFGYSRHYWNRQVETNKYEVPSQIRNSLQIAMEIATEKVPTVDGKVCIAVDVSGSMGHPVTGNQGSASTKVRCIDAAALVASAVLRKNEDATVLPFDKHVIDIDLNPYDTVMTNAEKLVSVAGGGTACSAPLANLNANKLKGDLVFFISDNESWKDSSNCGTAMMKEWLAFKQRCPKAKLVCLDITPNVSAQVDSDPDILRIGGFSDRVFEMVNKFLSNQLTPDHWVGEIDKVPLDLH